MALTGAAVAWVLRKFTSLTLVQSYAIGVFVMTCFAPALYVAGSDGKASFIGAWMLYGIGGVVGFVILYATRPKPKDKTPDEGSPH